MNLARVALAVSAVYAVFCVAIFAFQDRMIYQPVRKIAAYPSQAGLDHDEVEFRAFDGVALHGWFVPAGGSPGKALLFFHGNAGNISHRIESIRIFHDLGLDVFIFDYRGYGLSGGKPSEDGLYMDGRAALGVLVEKGYRPEDVIIFGRSLGGSVAARIAHENPQAALILESSFTSIADLASRLVPLFPVRLLLKSEYRTDLLLPEVRSPVLVIHSPEDEIIPFSEGVKLFEMANEPKRFLEISGDHNGGFLLSGPSYIDGLDAFISSVTRR